MPGRTASTIVRAMQPWALILGASSGAAFAAICPVLTALFGIAVLGEMPTTAEWVTIATISSGVYLVTGGPLPRWQLSRRARHR